MFLNLYNTILYQPLFNFLIFLYDVIPGNDIGLAIIVLTVVIRVALFPISLKSIKSQKAMQDLQPKLEELKRKYKGQKEKLASEMMKLYKEEKVNPLSSCLPLLIQLPFFIAVYQVFRSGLSSQNFDILYPFVSNPGQINTFFLGMDLSQPQVVLAVLAGLAQFWQAKMFSRQKPPQTKEGKPVEGGKDENMMAIMNKQMLYFMPIITVVIGLKLPGGLALYWFVTTLLLALQQLYFLRKNNSEKTKSDTISENVVSEQ